MSTSAHKRRCYLANNSARDIANSLFQKWAVKGFFPESPCRMLSLVLSFASKESTIPRRGGSPTTRAVVGASFPLRGKGYAPAGAPKGFPLALWKPSGTEAGENPIGLQVPTCAVVGATIPTRGKRYAPTGAPKGFPLALWKPSGTGAGENPKGLQVPIRAGVGASIPGGDPCGK